jgi:tRNA modification GTPase
VNAECCLLTPPGRGAVAVIEVKGSDRMIAVEPLFLRANGKTLGEGAIDAIRFGNWAAAAGEEVVVVRRASSIEIHCHGGRAASRRVIESLESRGVVEVSVDQWIARLESNRRKQAARRALEQAATERVALVLLDQYQGALERELETVKGQLNRGEIDAAVAILARLAESWQAGRWLTRPAQVVLTGPPNVGKSSLVNCLLGYERAIVFDEPGTTRDVVRGTTAVDGWPVVLSDTAGLRHGLEEIERAGIELAKGAVAVADVVVEVVDATEEQPAEGRPGSIRVANKIDRVDPERRAEWERQGFRTTSATTGENIAELLVAIARQLVPGELEPGQGVVFRHEDHLLVANALAACRAGQVSQARDQLAQVE